MKKHISKAVQKARDAIGVRLYALKHVEEYRIKTVRNIAVFMVALAELCFAAIIAR